MAKFFITTPIYYINDVPHIGTAYTTIAGDVLARWHRLKGDDVFFLTGLDENSIKTVHAARERGATSVEQIKAYTDEMATRFKEAWRALNITNNDFIRTTEERHRRIVSEFFLKVYEAGDIYKGHYEGLYCDGCEAFYLERELVGGLCPLHKKPPHHLSEENYFFKLSRYRDAILEHIEKNPSFVQPSSRLAEVVNFLKEGLRDVSISRPGLVWGITTPIDAKHVVWVWFDALLNYLSPREWWPADIHLIGKDILHFHAITWPAMLLSAGYALPRRIFAHGFLTIGGQKMSKSLGNVIDPVYLAQRYGSDSLRFCLFREIAFGEDGDFSEAALVTRHNNELVAKYSNLFYRVTAFVAKYFQGVVPQPGAFSDAEHALMHACEVAVQEADALMTELKLSEALARIMALCDEVNRYFQARAPWSTIKTKPIEAATACYAALNAVKAATILLSPWIPERSGVALKAMGVDRPTLAVATQPLQPGQRVVAEMLFKPIQ